MSSTESIKYLDDDKKEKLSTSKLGMWHTKILLIKSWASFYFRIFGSFYIFNILKIENASSANFNLHGFQHYADKIPLEKVFYLTFKIRFPSSRYRLVFIGSRLKLRHFRNGEIHTAIYVRSYIAGRKVQAGIRLPTVCWLKERLKKNMFGPIYISKKMNRTFYLRSSANGNIYLTVRKINKTDFFRERVKIFFAFCAVFFFKKRIPDNTLIFEKESAKYEESGSKLFEKIIDEGYTNVRFILDKESGYRYDEKYEPYILDKFSFLHYINFFRTTALISTEAPAHCIDLRICNFFAVNKLNSNAFQYVFLQHGVMYMVSLASKTRRAFRKGSSLYPSKMKVVVSSQLEANHFVKEGKFNQSDMYVTGLPKFDNAVHNSKAKKIVVMPTWRPWEYNLISQSYAKSGYYRMLKHIVKNTPENLRHRLVILPHPVFVDSVSKTPLKKYMSCDVPYEQVLRETAVLITDYSSIAYDAFNRGSNVIFWWKDKEECMSRYEGYLKINKENSFGDIVFNGEEYRESLLKNISLENQESQYVSRFRVIVEDFGDNSTGLLVKKLKKDHII